MFMHFFLKASHKANALNEKEYEMFKDWSYQASSPSYPHVEGRLEEGRKIRSYQARSWAPLTEERLDSSVQC
jgi:hypothetical protein